MFTNTEIGFHFISSRTGTSQTLGRQVSDNITFARLHLLSMTVNVKKTEVLHQPAPRAPYTAPMILLNGTPLNVTTTFKYLGSTIANDCSLNKELLARIQLASAVFGQLRERLWNKHNIKLLTKCKVYRAIMSSVQFRDIHAVKTSYSAIVTDTPTPLTSHPRNQVARPGDQQ